jgi:dihydroorotase
MPQKRRKEITIPKPFNAHTHWREIENAPIFAEITSKRFQGAISMLNLKIPINAPEEALDYQKVVLRKLPSGFLLKTPIMFNHNVAIETLERALNMGIKEVKYIPGDTSHNASQGIPLPNLLLSFSKHLKFMEDNGMRLLIHAELIKDKAGKLIKHINREEKAIPYVKEIIKRFPKLTIIFEHVSTKKLLQLIHESSDKVKGTVTPQHLASSYHNVFFQGEIIAPNNFCLPVSKTAKDRKALLCYISSPKNRKIMCGTDSAPHPIFDKMYPIPKPGCFSEIAAIETYFEWLEKVKGLNNPQTLYNFFYGNAAETYELPPSREEITLINQPTKIPRIIGTDKKYVPWRAGEIINWRIKK